MDERVQTTGPTPRRRRWRRGLAAVGLLLVAGILYLVGTTHWLAAFGGSIRGARRERVERSPHWADGVFQNPVPTSMALRGGYSAMMREYFFGEENRQPEPPPKPVRRVAADYPAPAPAGLRATWMGHATVLVELDGRRVLLDPIWSDRGSPSTVIGPRRFFDPPLPLAELPALDAVVISHDHYDHLDMQTIRDLAPRGARFVVPLGVGAHLEAWGIAPSQMVELDWGESTEVSGLRLTAAPARHFSGRGLFDRNRTLWASWVIAGPEHRVFFSGDSGWFDGFAATGEAHGPFDLTLIKIGAYGAGWPDIHVNPEEAVRAHRALRGKLLLPIHWGTFNLAFHSWNEPPDRLVAAARADGVRAVVPRPGELVDALAAHEGEVFPWWRGEGPP